MDSIKLVFIFNLATIEFKYFNSNFKILDEAHFWIR